MTMHPPAPPGPLTAPIPGGDLPLVRTDLAPAEVLARLETLSRRGRLPGFQRGGRGLFSVEAHGHPFDAELIAEAVPANPRGGELRFRLRMRRRMPAVFAVVLLATIWPGVYFMDELMPGEWGWISRTVYWWYLPITALPIPWIWRGLMRKSRSSNRSEAEEAIRKIAAAVGVSAV
jgi:hypothetical protein